MSTYELHPRAARREEMPGGREELVGRADKLLREILAAIGHGERDVSVDDLDEAQDVIELAIELIAERLQMDSGQDAGEVSRMADMLVTLERTLREFRAQARSERLNALANVHDALSRLRQIGPIGDLLPVAIAELCQGCNFDRGLILGFEGERLDVAAVYPGKGAGLPSAPPPPIGTTVCRDDALLELEAVRRRGSAVLVADPGDRELHCAFPDWRADAPYLASAIISAGQVVGIIEVDRAQSGRAFRRIDHDSLAGFALGLGYAFERAVLAGRLQAQSDEVMRLAQTAANLATDMSRPDLRLDAPAQGANPPDVASVLLAPRHSSPRDLLSLREQEVLELMATGSTNSQIAATLYIGEETVKSHVKRILRKLGATNRAQAVGLLRQSETADAGQPPAG